MSENPYAAPQEDPTPEVTGARGPLTSPYGPYRNINGIGGAVIISLIAGAIAAIAQIFALASLNDANTHYDTDLEAEASVDRWLEITETIGYFEVGTLLLTMVLWCIWKNKSCKNAWLFRSGQFQSPLLKSSGVTPGWAVGFYFIPIVQFWKPFQAMTFIRNEVADFFKGGPVLGLWWLTWLIMYNAPAFTSGNENPITTAAVNDYNQRLMIDSGLTVVATIPAVILIFTLSRAQRDKAKDLGLI